MNICILTLQFPPVSGGVATFVHRLSRQLSLHGHKIHVIAPGNASLEQKDSILVSEENGVTVHRLYPQLANFLSSAAAEFHATGEYIRQLHQQAKFDVLHAVFTTPTGHIATVVGELIHVPVVVSPFGSDLELLRYDPYLALSVQNTLERSTLISAQTDHQKTLILRAAPQTEVALAPIAFDKTLFSGDTLSQIRSTLPLRLRFPLAILERRKKYQGAHFVGTAGYFRYAKGPDIFLEGMAEVFRKDPNVYALLIGSFLSKDEEKKARQLMNKLGISRRVLITGEVPGASILSWLRELDVFVLPSRYEAAPNILFESMAAGVPMVSSHFEGVEEVLRDKENGLLFDIGDAGGLANCVTTLLNAPEKRAKFAEKSKEVLARYTPERELARWEEIYARALMKYKNPNGREKA